MADFSLAFKKTMGNEGGYSNNPDDVGKETYKGISRVYNSSWAGWKVIDDLKTKGGFPDSLKGNPTLTKHVKNFYKAEYWDKFLGDQISDQDIAMELFDTGVNMGIERSITFLQKGLNFLNRNQEMFPDLVEDGRMGGHTLECLETYCKKDSVEYLYKIMNILQGNHYLEYMSKSPIQEKYCRGWLNRVEFIKK